MLSLNTLASAFPTLTIVASDFPFFLTFGESQDVCEDRSFAPVPLKNASTQCCNTLQSTLQQHHGQYIVGDFDIVDDWMSIGVYEGCTLSVKATTKKDGENMAKWFIGDGDAYRLVRDTIEMAFHEGQGAAEGIIMCRWSRGGVRELYWRVWDARDD